MRKTTMRQAFEAAKVNKDSVPAVARKVLRVMERGAGIKYPSRRPNGKGAKRV